MPSALLPLVLLVTWCAPGAESSKPRDAPIYSAASIVNAADNQSGALAPNTIGTIYGKNLAYNTAALTADEVHGGILPTVLTGSAEVRVFINHYPADLYYVSPTQINFLVPPDLLPQPALFQVVIDGQYGTSPPIQFTLAAAAPALFQLDLKNAVATRADGSVITPLAPAQPGEIVVLWATGLGQTAPPAVKNQLPTAAAPLVAGANLSVLLDGVPVDSSAISYAGIAPGYAGLYQINLRLPSSTGANPEIRLQLDDAISIPQVYLPVMLN
jgi:uncharacterized protein (TIGR03437 family)